MVSGVIERRQTLPILSNVLMVLEGSELSLTGTDLEVELIGRVQVDSAKLPGSITVPARKLVDICKSLPEGSFLEVTASENKVLVKSGRSRFTLSALTASDFPKVDEEPDSFSLEISQAKLKALLDATSFAMAQQDVRYYLNGMLFEVGENYLRVVSTDGHRLAMETFSLETTITEIQQLILPRKGIIELIRLLSEEGGDIRLTFDRRHAVTACKEGVAGQRYL